MTGTPIDEALQQRITQALNDYTETVRTGSPEQQQAAFETLLRTIYDTHVFDSYGVTIDELVQKGSELAQLLYNRSKQITDNVISGNLDALNSLLTWDRELVHGNVMSAEGMVDMARGLLELARIVADAVGWDISDWADDMEERLIARRDELRDELQSAPRTEIDASRARGIAGEGTPVDVDAFVSQIAVAAQAATGVQNVAGSRDPGASVAGPTGAAASVAGVSVNEFQSITGPAGDALRQEATRAAAMGGASRTAIDTQEEALAIANSEAYRNLSEADRGTVAAKLEPVFN